MNRKWPSVSIYQDPVSHKDVEIDTDVVQQFSDRHPAKIEIEYTNKSDKERKLSFGISPPFSAIVTKNEEENALAIIPDDHNGIYVNSQEHVLPKQKRDDCWKLPSGGLVTTAAATVVTVEKHGSISEEYSILDGNNDTCLPSGLYRFEEDHYFDRHEPWGIGLKLER